MNNQKIQEILKTWGITAYKSWNKSQLRNTATTAVDQLNNIIDHHQKHAKSYFWTPPGGASGRRSEEKRKTFTTQIGNLFYSSDVSCSCKNYYYTAIFEFNNETKNLRIVKKMKKELEQILI